MFGALVGSVALGAARAEAQTTLPNQPPLATFSANGERVGTLTRSGAIGAAVPLGGAVFRTGQPLQLTALAADEDGLGFPVFAFAGISTPITFIWNFGGGVASNPLAIFTQQPVVTFNLPPGQDTSTFTVTLTVFDTTGLAATSTGSITIERSGPPVLNLVVGGFAVPSLGGVTTPTVFQLGPTVSLGSLAFDESGLGFPIFAGFGNPTPVSFLWNFGGGQPASVFDIFSPSPTVTFPTGPTQPTSFLISLTVFDATGQSTTRSVVVSLVPGTTRVLPGLPLIPLIPR